MFNQDRSPSKSWAWPAAIGLIGVLGGFLVGNWAKIFSRSTATSTPPASPTLLEAQQTDLTAAPAVASAAFGSETKASAIEKTEIEELVLAWQAAQNRGDFAAYSHFYATRMAGIKRVGKHRFEYDRDGWLADREVMFQKSMKVHLAGIQIRSTEQSAVARFDQSFAQGKFHDFGPKQLVLVREGGRLRIAREEMLESVVLDLEERVP